MFTSISWRIFEEARSKRVWSISSTFEYVPPFPPRVDSILLFLSLSLSLLFPLPWAFLDLPKQLPALWIFLRGRAGYRWKTRCARRDERVGKFSKVLAGTRSADNVAFQKTFCSIQRSFRRKLTNFYFSFKEVLFIFFLCFLSLRITAQRNICRGRKAIIGAAHVLHLKQYSSLRQQILIIAN